MLSYKPINVLFDGMIFTKICIIYSVHIEKGFYTRETTMYRVRFCNLENVPHTPFPSIKLK